MPVYHLVYIGEDDVSIFKDVRKEERIVCLRMTIGEGKGLRNSKRSYWRGGKSSPRHGRF
jgi:hypothetical protein